MSRFTRFRVLSLGAAASLAAAVVVPISLQATPAYALGTGALTVVTSGGAAENSGWTYSAGVVSLSSTPVSINASDLVAKLALGALTVDTDSIAVNSTMSWSNANSLTLKAAGSIVVTGGVTLESQGGAIVLNSDSDASGSGSIRVGAPVDTTSAAIRTHGGDLILGGGANPLTGNAMAVNADVQAGCGGNPVAGVAIFGASLNADGGAISIRGGSTSLGTSVSTRAVLIGVSSEGTACGHGAALSTAGSSSIDIAGDGSQINHSNGWGAVLSNASLTTAAGHISLDAIGSSTASNSRGYVLGGGNNFVSTGGGDITLTDRTNGATIATYNGIYNSGTSTLSTSGTALVQADEVVNDGTWVFVGPRGNIKPYTSTSFTAALTVGYVTAANCQRLQIGVPGNTSAVTLNRAITVGGDAYVHGGAIALTGALTAVNSTIHLFASTSATQTGALTATNLALNGAGSFTLQNVANEVANLAGGSAQAQLGSVAYTDATALNISTVGSLVGLTSASTINVATVSGNLSVLQPVVSQLASGDSVMLYASKPSAASTAGNGEIIITSPGTVTVASVARALLYSGARTPGTGLFALVGGESNSRSEYDATTVLSTISPALGSTGLWAIYRLGSPMAYTVSFDSQGGTSVAGVNFLQGGSIPLPSAPTRTGYSFLGWFTAPTGGSALGGTFTPAQFGPVTLYAQWSVAPAPSLANTGADATSAFAVFGVLFALGAAALAAARRTRRG